MKILGRSLLIMGVPLILFYAYLKANSPKDEPYSEEEITEENITKEYIEIRQANTLQVLSENIFLIMQKGELSDIVSCMPEIYQVQRMKEDPEINLHEMNETVEEILEGWKQNTRESLSHLLDISWEDHSLQNIEILTNNQYGITTTFRIRMELYQAYEEFEDIAIPEQEVWIEYEAIKLKNNDTYYLVMGFEVTYDSLEGEGGEEGEEEIPAAEEEYYE